MKKIILYLFLICLCGCTKNKVEKNTLKEKEPIGEFVYMDKYLCIHTDRTCRCLRNWGDKDTGIHSILFVEVDNFFGAKGYCNECVDDDIYKELKEISAKNWEQKRIKIESEVTLDSIVLSAQRNKDLQDWYAEEYWKQEMIGELRLRNLYRPSTFVQEWDAREEAARKKAAKEMNEAAAKNKKKKRNPMY